MSAAIGDSPAHLGYRMPAEWARHAATWLSWPHNAETWPDCFDMVEPTMVEVVRVLATGEAVHINVLDAAHEAHVHGLIEGLVPPASVRTYICPTDDAWIRDHGAIFVTRGSELAALDFEYNAWGGKYPPFDRDRKVARYMADALGVGCFASPFVLEGGAIDVNGAGALLTTEQCLLNANRNPDLDPAGIEAMLRAYLGVAQIIWLGRGVEGDDTDGHVDDLARFVAEDTVVAVVEPDTADANYTVLRENREALSQAEIAGKPLRVVELPMPDPVYNGMQRLPASYANFYVANSAVLMPAFGCAQDTVAQATLAQCFPDRRVVAIDCRSLVAGLGALHCLTKQVPAGLASDGELVTGSPIT